MFCAFVNAVLDRLAPPPPLLNSMAVLKRLHTVGVLTSTSFWAVVPDDSRD